MKLYEIIIDEKHSRYIMECDYNQRRVPGRAGFKFDKETKKWYTDDIEKAKILLRHPLISIEKSLMLKLKIR